MSWRFFDGSVLLEKIKNAGKAEQSVLSGDDGRENINKTATFPPRNFQAGQRADKEALRQLENLRQEFKRVGKMPQQLRQRVTDSEYWCAVCFQSREQLMAFLKVLDIPAKENKYVDGLVLAQKLGITLPPAEVRFRLSDHVDKDFQELTEK